ncbi:polysaccharide deacetylase family protein [Paraburkholderia fungorum]|jgi:peptidoglycan/xylan/chitin deacetylase (PgdA/CDA1 family)|uniref:polysaccharide deacetylase family protein n=1 Tax=Paraburkholderia fungorum TaxID=134537 RepID=UPI0038BD4482
MRSTKTAVKKALAHCIVGFGIDRAIRALLWRDRVAVLLYHDPKPEALDQHLSYLKTICDLVPLSEIGSPGSGRPRAAVTLDDGNIGNAHLLPVFIKHKLRPTIFLCSRFVGRPARHWWLHPGATQAGIERLKKLTNEERLRELAKYGYAQSGEDNATGLTIEQLKAMQPFVDFQAHTQYHPILTRCNDDDCKTEITGCKSELETLLSRECEHFAYPNGNYGDREIKFVRAAGYKTARTCDLGWNDSRSDPYRLKTIVVDDDASELWFVAQLTGIPVFLRYLRHGGSLSGRSPQF